MFTNGNLSFNTSLPLPPPHFTQTTYQWHHSKSGIRFIYNVNNIFLDRKWLLEDKKNLNKNKTEQVNKKSNSLYPGKFFSTYLSDDKHDRNNLMIISHIIFTIIHVMCVYDHTEAHLNIHCPSCFLKQTG